MRQRFWNMGYDCGACGLPCRARVWAGVRFSRCGCGELRREVAHETTRDQIAAGQLWSAVECHCVVINDGGGLFRFGGWGLEARDRTFENGGFVGHKRDGYYQLLWVTVTYYRLPWVTDGGSNGVVE